MVAPRCAALPCAALCCAAVLSAVTTLLLLARRRSCAAGRRKKSLCCPPCRRTVPQYALARHTFLDRCRLLLSVAVDQQPSDAELARLRRHGLGDWLLTDCEWRCRVALGARRCG